MSHPDSDSSIELVYDSATVNSKNDKKTNSPVVSGGKTAGVIVGGASSPSPPLTHYRCVKFEALSEIELVVRKWHTRSPAARAQSHDQMGAGPDGATPEELDLAEALATVRANLPPLGTVFFTLLTGRVESFGIQLVPNRLYSLHFGARFVAQTFHGCELCFLIRNPDASFDIHAKYIDPPAYRPKNLAQGTPTPMPSTTKEMTFIPLASPGFTSYDLKSESVDLSTLMPLIRLDTRVSPAGSAPPGFESKRGPSCNANGSDERWRLALNVKQFGKRFPGGQKPPNWVYQSYVHLSQELNRQRKDAAKGNRSGPNVIIVGPCDAGKSTLTKILVNYAVNEHWSPMLIDLDVGQGAIGVPGIVGAGVIDEHCQLDEEFTFRAGYPHMVHFGGITPDSDKSVHGLSINCLVRQILHSLRAEEEEAKKGPSLSQAMSAASFAEKLSSTAAKRSSEQRSTSPMTTNSTKQQKRQLTKWSGLIINTHGWIFDYGYESTLDAIRKFGITTVLVLGDYRLYERMHKDLLGFDVLRGGAGSGAGLGSQHPRNYNQAAVSGSNLWSVTPVSGMKVLFFQRNFSAVKRHSKLRRRMRMDRFARFFEPSLVGFPMAIVTVPFAHHPVFRFFSQDHFTTFLGDSAGARHQWGGMPNNGANWPPMNPKAASGAGQNYWSGKVEKLQSGKDRRGPAYEQVVFYHLNRETLVYLLSRVLSILTISIDELLSHDQSWFRLRELLATQAFARVIQVDLETESFDVELPASLAPALRNGQLVLLEIETVGPRRAK